MSAAPAEVAAPPARPVERALEAGLLLGTALAVGALVAFLAVLLGLGLLGLTHGFALALWWGDGGVLVPLLGTALVTGVATLLALPIGLVVGVWLAFFSPEPWRDPVRVAIGALAGIPSVVFGLVGLTVLAPLVASVLDRADGRLALTGALLLAFLAVPSVVVRTEAALRAVPSLWVDSAVALGATRLQAVRRVVLPAAWRGVLMAGVLGTVRALGDTMVVLMVTGTATAPGGIFDPVRTATETIVTEFGSASPGSSQRASLYLLALVLLAVTVGLHVAATRRTST